jgi:hypothetical protein
VTSFMHDDLAAWAERKRVRGHLTDGRADPDKCTCAGQNCLAAQAVADHLRACEGAT